MVLVSVVKSKHIFIFSVTCLDSKYPHAFWCSSWLPLPSHWDWKRANLVWSFGMPYHAKKTWLISAHHSVQYPPWNWLANIALWAWVLHSAFGNWALSHTYPFSSDWQSHLLHSSAQHLSSPGLCAQPPPFHPVHQWLHCHMQRRLYCEFCRWLRCHWQGYDDGRS